VIRPGVRAAAGVLAVVTACAPGTGGPANATDESLTIFGAASLKDALAEIKTAYEAVQGVTLTVATGSSATLRTQIEEGAPADVLLAADQQNAQRLADAGLADGRPMEFAGNQLTIIVPTNNPGRIETPADLARVGVKIVAAGDEVPITKYANQAVTNLAAQPGYPVTFADAYAANVVSREENVNAVVAKVELGEGDAAIVYITDAMASKGVTTVEIPASANVRATYAGVVVTASTRAAAGHAFLEWLTGPNGAAILAALGFQRPS
jgi:molybdate transport system substrate-binding protein